MLAPSATSARTGRRPSPGRAATALTAATTTLSGALAALYAVCVLTAVGQRHEDAVHSATRSGGDGMPWPASLVLHPLVAALQPVHLVAGLAAVALLAVLRRRWVRAVAAVGVVLVSIGLTELLKLVVLPRPALASGSGSTAHNSFPSGHTTTAVSLVLAALLAVPPRLRRAAGVVGALAAGAMAGTVIDTGWHRVSDVLGSALLSAAVWCAGSAVVVLRERRRGSPPPAAAVRAAALLPPLACLAALVAVYVLPGSGLLVAVAAPAAAVAVTVLATAAATPGERAAPSGGSGAERAG